MRTITQKAVNALLNAQKFKLSNTEVKVLENVSVNFKGLQILPIKPKQRKLTEFFRKENINELINEISLIIESL